MLNRLRPHIARSRAFNVLIVLLFWVFALQPFSGMARSAMPVLPQVVHSDHCADMQSAQAGMSGMDDCVCADHVLCVMSCPLALKFLASPLFIVAVEGRPIYPLVAEAPKPWGIQSPLLRPPIS